MISSCRYPWTKGSNLRSNFCRFLCWAVGWTTSPWDQKLQLQIILKRETYSRHSQNSLRAGTLYRVWWRQSFMCTAKGQGATSKRTFWFGCKMPYWRMAVGGVNCCIMFLSDLFNSVIITIFFYAEKSALMGGKCCRYKGREIKKNWPLYWWSLGGTQI